MTQYELVQARRYLQQDVLALRRVEGISSTTLKIVWDVSGNESLRLNDILTVLYAPTTISIKINAKDKATAVPFLQVLTDYNEYLEGVKIWFNGTSLNRHHAIDFQNIHQTNDSLESFIELTKYDNFTMTTVHNSGSSSHLLTGLMPYAKYNIFLMPFYKLLLGKPSNMRSGLTDEDSKYLIRNHFFSI